ncbi:hypothetical protein AVEN_185824-1, partial [Araneus ventricosus]
MEKDEDEADTQAKKVVRNEADEGLQTFVKFAEQWPYTLACDVRKLYSVRSEFLRLWRRSCKNADMREFHVMRCM